MLTDNSVRVSQNFGYWVYKSSDIKQGNATQSISVPKNTPESPDIYLYVQLYTH